MQVFDCILVTRFLECAFKHLSETAARILKLACICYLHRAEHLYIHCRSLSEDLHDARDSWSLREQVRGCSTADDA